MYNNNVYDVVLKSINYIEDNIKTNIRLDDISSHVNITKYQLERVFRSITNRPLIDYVRNRKLSLSLDKLFSTHLKIIDIAYEYDFKYEQSYVRAFKNTFGLSPNRVRKQKPTLEITPAIDINDFIPLQRNGLIIKPKIVVKPSFTLAGIKYIADDEDNRVNFTLNKLGNDFFINHKPKLEIIKNPNVYIGLVQYGNMHRKKIYMPSVELTHDTCITELVSGVQPSRGIAGFDMANAISVMTIPINLYAVFRYVGLHHPVQTTIAHLQQIYDYIFACWLRNSSYTLGGNYHFEHIDVSAAHDDYCEVDIYVPLSKKSGEKLYKFVQLP